MHRALGIGPRHDSLRSVSAVPAFTIVIPAYNAQATLGSCVRSALSQSESDLEVVIVDDGSTDRTGEMASSFDDPRVSVIAQPNRGLPAARNAGVRRARAETVCFLDADDLLLPHYLETVRRTLSARPSADFVYCDAYTFDDRTRRVRRNTTTHYVRRPSPPPSTPDGMLSELIKRNFMIIPVAVRRAVIEAAGLFDESMTAAEDWDMWLRLSAAGHLAVEVPEPLGLRREHASQMSADHGRMVTNHIYMWEKLLAGPPLAPEREAEVRERLADARRIQAAMRGHDRVGALRRGARLRLGALKRRAGFGARWYREPPPVVKAAFGDLSDV
jgi:glycosyltransferase involved in cell wall biosynthesis